MAQRRFWNYLDDDLTIDLTRWITGLIPSGLYRGFDWSPAAGMNLILNHETTGYKYVDKDQNETSNLGVVITRQGVIVQDDTVLSLAIAANSSGNPRIDIIILSHEYEEFEGGSDALYSVIQGTPSSTPVAPAVGDDKKDVIIGYLYVPDGTTSLLDAGVIYTRPDIPMIAGNSNIPLKNKVNSFTKSQQVKSAKGIRIVEFEYTNGDTYTKQVLEIDPTTNHYILDLDDSEQIGTYDPTSGSVVFLIKPTAGFNDSLSGFSATIRVKGTTGKRLKLVPTTPDPEPLSADGLYSLGNRLNILSANKTVDTVPYALEFDVASDREQVFKIHFDGDQNFILDPGTLKDEKYLDNSLVEETIKGLIANYTTGNLMIVNGCVIAATIPGTSTITAGCIYYNGKLYKVPAASVVTISGQTLVFKLVSDQNRVIQLVAANAGTELANYNDTTKVIKLFESDHEVVSDKIQQSGVSNSGYFNWSIFSSLHRIGNKIFISGDFSFTITNATGINSGSHVESVDILLAERYKISLSNTAYLGGIHGCGADYGVTVKGLAIRNTPNPRLIQSNLVFSGDVVNAQTYSCTFSFVYDIFPGF